MFPVFLFSNCFIKTVSVLILFVCYFCLLIISGLFLSYSISKISSYKPLALTAQDDRLVVLIWKMVLLCWSKSSNGVRRSGELSYPCRQRLSFVVSRRAGPQELFKVLLCCRWACKSWKQVNRTDQVNNVYTVKWLFFSSCSPTTVLSW